MSIPPRVFLDASVFIAAAGSSTGASSSVLELCRGGLARAVATQRVLQEAERNIESKLGDDILVRFYQQIAGIDLAIADPPSAESLSKVEALIHPKDLHVLAAAIESRSKFLLTLDRKHFMTSTLREARLDLTILTPGEFLRQWPEDDTAD